jgi:hypothetical protein
MIINDLNTGEKADYSLNGNFLVLSFFDKSIGLDLEVMQEDEKKTVDICTNQTGNLIEGIDKWAVANITIPAAEYELQDTGEVDEDGETVYEKVKKPFNLDEVVLDLWSLPNYILKQNQKEEVIN